MPLSAGDKLGPYEILASIGAGGMGEVYRARDARLNRDVAIKVSGEQFSERFESEAKAIAALNHHVAVIHAGLGHKDQAFALLDQAYKDRSYYLPTYLATDARMDSLRSDPRFGELNRRAGLPE
jgi:serine/threonine protein kinase